MSRIWAIVFKAAKSDKVSPVRSPLGRKMPYMSRFDGQRQRAGFKFKVEIKDLNTLQKPSFCPRVRDLQLRAQVEDTS